jgi:hypothetical protein
LPKSIAGLPGADLDRFEQHIVLRVSGHVSSSLLPTAADGVRADSRVVMRVCLY